MPVTPLVLNAMKDHLYNAHRNIEMLLHLTIRQTEADAQRAERYLDALVSNVCAIQNLCMSDAEYRLHFADIMGRIALRGDTVIEELRNPMDPEAVSDSMHVAFSARYEDLKRNLALAPLSPQLRGEKRK